MGVDFAAPWQLPHGGLTTQSLGTQPFNQSEAACCKATDHSPASCNVESQSRLSRPNRDVSDPDDACLHCHSFFFTGVGAGTQVDLQALK